ncbi:extracellular solute-binding protein [Paenibacillus sp. IB182496]|uniref:Extracellular solute-binding protein n=1 Tax=Paenibacillus sabuli TaxID=2772509 RepID=A0A927BX52_9BACL|nr:extracellular solute-binding protein [Paenibacillus sabuli]MBD2848503.1 extracellular solute-binding protein [Paenibacillus sabuli]
MRMQRRRWMGMAAGAVLTGALLAGCSGGDGDKESGTGGESANGEARAAISVSIYDRGSIPGEQGTAEDNRWTRWLEENGPVDLDFQAVPRWESIDKFNVMFASGTAPDLIFEYATGYRNELINQKQLMPIGELIEQHSTTYKALLEEYPLLRQVGTREDGQMYEFARLNGVYTNHVLFVRKDWLDRLGLGVPQTTDEFYAAIEAFVRQDPDGNGQDDTLGMAVTGVSGQVLEAMFQDVGYKVEDGTLVRTWDNAIAHNRFVKKLYDNGLIDRDFLTDKNGEKAKQDFINGKLGFYGSNAGAGGEGYSIYTALKKNVPDAEVMAIELPESEFGQFSPVIGNPVQATAAINANADNPEAVMAYVDFLTEEATMRTLTYGIEGEHYELAESGCPKPIDAEKNKQEQDWTGDMRMLVSTALFGECGTFRNRLDMDDPIDKAFSAIIDQAEAAYLTPERPMAQYTHVEHMSSPPKDLQLIVTNTAEQLRSYVEQALVGGAKTSVEQAVADQQAYWKKSGGEQVDAWYAEWYETNSDDAILTEDLYTLGN